jgi:hypothetical protein
MIIFMTEYSSIIFIICVGSGFLEPPELPLLLKSLGREVDESQLEGILLELDDNGDGEISFEEFYAWFYKWDDDDAAEANNEIHDDEAQVCYMYFILIKLVWLH